MPLQYWRLTEDTKPVLYDDEDDVFVEEDVWLVLVRRAVLVAAAVDEDHDRKVRPLVPRL